MKNLLRTVGLLMVTFQSVAFVTMGTDVVCNYDSTEYTLQQVIDLEAPREIRVTNQQEFYENIEIDSSATLKGGFQSCSAALNNNATGKTTIDGGAQSSVVKISDFNDTAFISLYNFNVKNGHHLGSSQGGGVSIIDNNDVGVDIRFFNSLISNNTGNYGGGIYQNGGLVALTLFDTVILNNNAEVNGGGMYCYDGYVFINDDSGVALNSVFNASSSFGNGGGVFATGGCRVNVWAGTQGSLFDFKGIAGNSASNHGGGLYASNSSIILLNSTFNNEVINISGNQADADHNGSGEGGGIYLSGVGTRAELYGALVKENQAQNGGGIAVVNGARLFVERYFGDCWNNKKCNEFNDNKASKTGGLGGAIYLLGGHAEFSHAIFNENRADNGVAMYADNSSTAKVRSSYVYNNGLNSSGGWDDIFTFRFYDSGLVLNHVTIANNNVVGASIRQNAGYYSYTNSIIYEPIVGLDADITNIYGAENCLLLDDDSGFDNLTNSTVANPYFVDEDNHDYHLSAISHAIDMCSDDVHTLPTDHEGEIMWDDPNLINGQGIRDAGADESYLGDVIFSSIF